MTPHVRPRDPSRRLPAAPPLAALMVLAAVWSPARSPGAEKHLYIANDDHTDYFWTADDVTYRQAFQTMLDYYMDQAETTASNPPDARGRFNTDGSLWVWEYERNRSAADFDRLVGHLRSGTITMPLNTLVLLYGAMPAEAVIRNMYYAGRLERRHDLRFPLVVPMEDQTLPGGVASLWAGAGARYAWKGICGCASQIDAADRPREIYHFQGHDGASVCVKWNSMRGGNTGVGGYAEARDPYGVVGFLDTDPAFLASWPWPVAAAFGYGHDDLQTTTDLFVGAALDLGTAGRRVIVSNEIDFFEDFLASHGADIPTFGASFGNEWDLLTASMGAATAGFKRHLEKLRTAEALATVVSLHDPAFMDGRDAARDRAFLACGLYYEHDWTADGPVPRSERIRFQRDLLADLEGYVHALHDDALAELAALVSGAPGAERHLVFNPLSWARTDAADLAVQATGPVHVVDVATGAEVPSQPVTVNGAALVRILARDVPPVGYRVYEVRPGEGLAYPDAAAVTLPSFDNQLYGVTLGPGGDITGLIDHRDGDRELVDVKAGGSIHDLGAGTGAVELESTGPVSATLRVSAGGSPQHETRVTLYHRDIDRLDIEGWITQNFDTNQGYRSRFDLPGAVMHHEEVGMIARVARVAQGGDYADQNARTDYLTFNHFVDLGQPGTRGVTISNWDSAFFRAGQSTVDVLDGSTPSIYAVVGMQVDGPGLGIAGQAGDTEFLNRFALRTYTGPYSQPGAMRFALEHQNPLTAARLTGAAGGPLPAASWSLLAIDDPDVLLWALKPAEEGVHRGIVARVWNLAPSSREMELSLTGATLGSAMRTTHIETDLDPLPLVDGAIRDTLAREQMSTYRLVAGGAGVDDQPVASPRPLLRVYPNPVSGSASNTIAFMLSRPGHARVRVHDAGGRLVRILADGPRSGGWNTVTWRGDNERGTPVAAGVYLVRLDIEDRVEARKIVKVR